MKKTLLLAMLTLVALTAHAQHFDWVKTYSGQGETHEVISSFADNDGNLYILGHFTRGAQINGVDLLPLPNANPNNTSIVIAKLTADGNLAWHKSIYSSRTSSYGYCMKPIGSNRFIVMAIVSLPYDHGYGELNDLYYLDTLLTGNDNYLVSFDSCTSNTKNVFITFDFNGNVVEQHFVELGYLDNFGQPITPRVLGRSNSEKLSTSVLSNELFGIDNSGHIYVARTTVDLQTRVCDTCEGGYRSWTIENGTIGMLKIMVDDTLALYCPTEPLSHWNQQVLVFSPHLDSIVGNFYVFDSTVGIENIYPQSQIWSINIDNQDNVYITVYGNGLPESVRIARSEALHLTTNSCMIKYNPSFFATNTVQLSSTPDPLNFPKLYGIRSTYFDYDTRSLFIMGEVQRDPMTYNNPSCHILYSGDTLDLRNNAMWLRLDMDDMHLISYGKAASSIETSMNDINGTLAIKNNRVFSQILYQGDILWLDTTISIESTDRGMGLMAWDYEGHEIAFYDFNAVHINNRPSQTHIVDSVLYMTGMLFSGATFGNLDPIPAASGSQAFIARYVDTAFLTPYTPIDTTHTDPIDTGSVRITVLGDEGAFVAYPNPFRQKVTIEVQGGQLKEHNGTVTAILTDLSGRREEVRLTPIGPGQYSLDLTSRPQATYLLTLTTTDGKQHTVRLLKQTDVFGN